jgi:hypothetical protein
MSRRIPSREETMQTLPSVDAGRPSPKPIAAAKHTGWDIDRDVIRSRTLDRSMKFMPDGLSRIDRLPFLNAGEQRLMSQIQGRTYANMFGMIERYIGAKTLEISRDYFHGGDPVTLEALVRFTDEELKHQELFRRIEATVAADMPLGYTFLPRPNDVANAVLSKSTWAVLALTCHIEIFTQAHYRESIQPDPALSELWKDVFRFHSQDESRHAVLDEHEWRREDQRLTSAQRDAAVSDLIELIAAVDAILQMQAKADTDYFLRVCARTFDPAKAKHIGDTMLRAYRWQYIVSGVRNERFQQLLRAMVSEAQFLRLGAALAPIMP